MAKRLAFLGTTMVAFAAFAMPAIASASPVLTDPKGTALKLPAIVEEVVLEGKVTNTEFGTIECELWTFRNGVTKNNGSSVEEVGVGGDSEGCFAGNVPLTITESEVTTLSTSTLGTGTAGLSFVVDTGPFECEFEGKGEIIYEAETDVIDWPEIVMHSSELCEPEEGDEIFHASKTMKTPNTGPIILIS